MMIKPLKNQKSAPKRMAEYRQRMRAAGLRPVQIWLPDTRAPEFAAICSQQSLAIAKYDPGGDELMDFIEKASDWSDI